MSSPASNEPKLRKTLTLPQIVALYVGSVIGSGIPLVPGLAAEMAGPASTVAWAAMSLLVVPMAVTMGLYPSLGWFALYPLAVVAIVLFPRKRRSVAPAESGLEP